MNARIPLDQKMEQLGILFDKERDLYETNFRCCLRK